MAGAFSACEVFAYLAMFPLWRVDHRLTETSQSCPDAEQGVSLNRLASATLSAWVAPSPIHTQPVWHFAVRWSFAFVAILATTACSDRLFQLR